MTVLTAAHGTAPGYIFIAPKEGVEQGGPLILRNDGQVVWFRPLDTHRVANFRVQRYRGQPVLTWWRGETLKAGSNNRNRHNGHYVIADDSYRVIATVTAANGLGGDLHDFLLTPRNTALFTIYHRVPYDLSALGGPKHGTIAEGVVQEVDVATGRLLFEWHSLDHVSPKESYEPLPKPASNSYDYFHINSIDVEPNGNLLVSGRYTHAVYEIRRSDGAVVWRLGGKRSDFALGPAARFAWQHDVERQPDGTITMFDNEAHHPKAGLETRVLVLRLDEKRRTASVVRTYTHPNPLLAPSQGSAQFLPDGHVFVGWGSEPYATEFDHAGDVLLDLRFGASRFDSYRAYRFRWHGHPTDPPALAVVPGSRGTTVYASWNGATEVAGWRVLAGPDRQHLTTIAEAAKSGFETSIRVRSRAHVFEVAALDAKGRVMRISDPAVGDG